MASAYPAGPIRSRGRCCCQPSSAGRQNPASPWSGSEGDPGCNLLGAGRGSLGSPRLTSSSDEMPRLLLQVRNTASIFPVCCVYSLPRAVDRDQKMYQAGSRAVREELRTNPGLGESLLSLLRFFRRWCGQPRSKCEIRKVVPPSLGMILLSCLPVYHGFASRRHLAHERLGRSLLPVSAE